MGTVCAVPRDLSIQGGFQILPYCSCGTNLQFILLVSVFVRAVCSVRGARLSLSGSCVLQLFSWLSGVCLGLSGSCMHRGAWPCVVRIWAFVVLALCVCAVRAFH